MSRSDRGELMPASTKHQVLALLEHQRGSYISGQNLAQTLNLSRNSIWKAIKELQSEGYAISATPNKGYCLSKSCDKLSATGIAAHLAQEHEVHVYPTLESTNKTAKELAVAGAKHGTLVITNKQTAGRGRFSRSFHSPAGGVYLSLILSPAKFQFNTPTLVTAFAAVAVCEAIEQLCDQQPSIKWVNDIFLGKKKVCGILTEAVADFESGQISWIVVGIGVNVRADFPEELAGIATSLEANIPRNQLIAEIVNNLLTPRSEETLLAQYKQRLNCLGKQVLVNSEYPATAIGLDEAAHLIIRKPCGEIQALSSGEISIVTLG